MQELDSMTPDDFRAEVHDSLTSFYVGVLKGPCAGGFPNPRSANAVWPQSSSALPSASGARSDSRAQTPVPAPAAAEGATALLLKLAKPGKGAKASCKGGR
jgi:hypothetical protein